MSTKKEKWANRIPLAVRRLVRSLVRAVQVTITTLSSDSKDLADRIHELKARVMDETRKDPESDIVHLQDPWFSQLDLSTKKSEKPESPPPCIGRNGTGT